jgi:hypothetical protein
VRVRPKRLSVVGDALALTAVSGEATTDENGSCQIIVPRLSAVQNSSTTWVVDATIGSRVVLEATEFNLTDDETTFLSILLT